MLKKTTLSNYFCALLSVTSCAMLISLSGQAQEKLDLSKLEQKWLCFKQQPVKTHIAKTNRQRMQGLSFFSPSQFSTNQAIYFAYPKVGYRQFWMPNTFFPLNIIFIDQNMQVVAIERDVRASPLASTPKKDIKRTKRYRSKDVIELHHKNSWDKNLKIGDQISWCLPGHVPSQKESDTPVVQ